MGLWVPLPWLCWVTQPAGHTELDWSSPASRYGVLLIHHMGARKTSCHVRCPPLWPGDHATNLPRPVLPHTSPERIRKERLESGLRLSVTNLRSHDSGNFSCETQLADQTIVLKSFILYVRPRELSSGAASDSVRCGAEDWNRRGDISSILGFSIVKRLLM